jgi:hypothetical protein
MELLAQVLGRRDGGKGVATQDKEEETIFWGEGRFYILKELYRCNKNVPETFFRYRAQKKRIHMRAVSLARTTQVGAVSQKSSLQISEAMLALIIFYT